MWINHLALLFSYIASLSVLLPLFYFFNKKANFKQPILHILSVLLIVGGLTDIAEYILGYGLKYSTLWILNIYFLIEFGLISLLFVRIYPKLKTNAIVSGILFLLLFICTCIFLQPITSYQSITRIAAAILFIFYTAVYYRHLMKALPVDNILHHMPFWIITAVFFYFGMSFYVFCLSSYVFNNDPGYAMIFWVSRGLSEIVKNIFFTIGIARFTRRQLLVTNL